MHNYFKVLPFVAGCPVAALDFVTVGDWGAAPSDSSDRLTMTTVAGAFGDHAKEQKPKFILSLGDNFYEDGVGSTEDPLWQDTWRAKWVDPFPQLSEVPWYPILGNHDYRQGASGAAAQIERTTATDDDEWQFDSTTWVRTFSLGASSSDLLAVVAIDTQEINFSEYSYTESLFSEASAAAALSKLEKVLAAAAGDPRIAWIIMAGHFPILSRGEHGDNEVLSEGLLNILSRFGVDMYISGHDHTLQHIEYRDTHFVISGNGAKKGSVADDDNTNEPYLLSEYTTHLRVVDPGFTSHTVSASTLTTTFINADGAVIHSFEQSPRCKRNCFGSSSSRSSTLTIFFSWWGVVIKITAIVAGTGLLVTVGVNVWKAAKDRSLQNTDGTLDAEAARLLAESKGDFQRKAYLG